VAPAPATGSDICGGVMITNQAAGQYPLGTTITHYSDVDDFGNTSSCTSSITIHDTTPPVISGPSNNGSAAAELWSPDHKMQTVDVRTDCGLTIHDACDSGLNVSNANIKITGITSDELVNTLGDGNTAPDMLCVDATHVQLRKERAGNEDGRVYKITFTVTDAEGQVSTGICRIDTTHSQNGAPSIDSGVHTSVSCP